MQFSRQVDPLKARSGVREGAANLILVACVVLMGLIAGIWLAFSKTNPEVTRTEPRSPVNEPRSPVNEPRSPVNEPRLSESESRSFETETRSFETESRLSDDETASATNAKSDVATKKFPVNIRKPGGPPRVFTGINDVRGNPVTVACSTCHATRKPNFENKTVADLDEFHGSLSFAHGTVSCLSCHNPTDYNALKLADGSRVEFTDVMTLCAQCHGPQMRDYQHGAHGGFNGHWDLTRGPQQKNNCVDCHNPHAPQFPKMQPTFKPRDRFLKKVQAKH